MTDWINKLRDLFTKNLVWKFLSLVIAVMLWFVVINVRNPLDIRSFPQTLQIVNKSAIEDGQYILTNEEALDGRSVNVRVRASITALQELKENEKSIRAYIDLKPIDISRTEELGKPMSVNVKVDLPSHLDSTQYEIISWNPSTVDIVLDKYVEEEFPVTPIIEKDVPDGYVSLTATADPAFVTVRGAKSVIDTIKLVKAPMDISAATDDVTETIQLMILDDEDNDVTNLVAISAYEAVVRVPVSQHALIPIAAPTLIGNPAAGYRFLSATLSMDSLEVLGKEAAIAAMEPIQLPTINIDYWSETDAVTFDLRQFITDAGLTVRSGAPHEVTVTISIGRETMKELSIPIESLTIDGMERHFMLPEGSVRFMVRGDESVVSALDAGSVPASIDLTGLDVGQASVPVNVQLPSGVILVGGKPEIVVEILEEAPVPSGVPDETESPVDDLEPQEPEVADEPPQPDDARD